jgi:hypothetical protein
LILSERHVYVCAGDDFLPYKQPPPWLQGHLNGFKVTLNVSRHPPLQVSLQDSRILNDPRVSLYNLRMSFHTSKHEPPHLKG